MLRSLSRIAGVPLIPHPFRDACVQINYYSAEPAAGGGARVAKWHTDGMDYVFTMLLTDASGYSGGEYTYFRGPADAFDPETVADDDRTQVARFFRRGEAVFTRGSHVYHAVTPVREGRRTTIAFSMFCPFFARRDSNSFWHSAPDDGLLRTIHNWWTFKMPWYGPRYYYQLTQAPAIGWNEIGR